MISIIIPVYNQAEKLDQCLASIKKQKFDNYEIIVVDDGSKDNAEEVYVKYKEVFSFKISLITQDNKGANAARNAGFRRAKGEFLLFCDADLILEANMLVLMLEALKNNPEAGYAYCSFKFGHKTFKLWPFDHEKLKKMPYIHTTSLIRREIFPLSGWDENIKRLQDWDLWLTMMGQGHYGVWIDRILFKVQSGGTMSNWLPSFAYKILPFLPKVKKYNEAVAILKAKHGII